MQLRDLHPRRFFLETWRSIDVAATQYRAAQGGASTSDALLSLYVFVVVAGSLVLQEYMGTREVFSALLYATDDPIDHPWMTALFGWIKLGGMSLAWAVRESRYFDLWVLCYWAAWRVIGFLLIPTIAILLYSKLRRTPLGLSIAGMRNHLWVYAVLFVPVFIAVFCVSFTDEFSTYYPFYSGAHRSLFEFCVWESFYIAQFFALEFFFRGFMLQPLARYMGSSAIFAMTVPYVMIHIGKPILECYAAIIAGVVLGTLALRTKSIWAGFLIHVSVALSMDILAIWQKYWR